MFQFPGDNRESLTNYLQSNQAVNVTYTEHNYPLCTINSHSVWQRLVKFLTRITKHSIWGSNFNVFAGLTLKVVPILEGLKVNWGKGEGVIDSFSSHTKSRERELSCSGRKQQMPCVRSQPPCPSPLHPPPPSPDRREIGRDRRSLGPFEMQNKTGLSPYKPLKLCLEIH